MITDRRNDRADYGSNILADISAGTGSSDGRKSVGAPMQQIADWLEELGMSEYAQHFAENRIDFSVLPDLTDQDLEKLGVVLGDRRKMLRAIAALGGAPPAAAASAAPVTVTTAVAPKPATQPISAPPETTGERRYLTVMFCDLGQRFHGSNHIRQPRRAYRTRCG